MSKRYLLLLLLHEGGAFAYFVLRIGGVYVTIPYRM